MGMRKMREFTKKQTLWPILMGGVQPSQGYRATTWRRFTFKHSVPMSSWYSFDRPRKDERLSWLWIHPGVLSRKPLDWESSALTTRLIRILQTWSLNTKNNLIFYQQQKSTYFHLPPLLCHNPWFFSDMTFFLQTVEFLFFFFLSFPNIINLFHIFFLAKSILLYYLIHDNVFENSK